MDLYAENILDHYRHPRYKESITDPDIEHEEINHSCGDELKVQIAIQDRTVSSIGWSGTGCAISQAGMSILSEELQGMTLEEIYSLKKSDIYNMLGVPVGPRRFKCALLCLHTVKNALRKTEGLSEQSWLDTVEIEG